MLQLNKLTYWLYHMGLLAWFYVHLCDKVSLPLLTRRYLFTVNETMSFVFCLTVMIKVSLTLQSLHLV